MKNGCLVIHYEYLEKRKGNFVEKQEEITNILQKNRDKLCSYLLY
jgi:hypothetical protein